MDVLELGSRGLGILHGNVRVYYPCFINVDPNLAKLSLLSLLHCLLNVGGVLSDGCIILFGVV